MTPLDAPATVPPLDPNALDKDGHTAIDPVYRFGSFDTVEYQREHADDIVYEPFKPFDDAMRVQLEQFLLNHAEYGQAFIMVEAPSVPKPCSTTR